MSEQQHPHRFQHEASINEKAAYALAHAGFSTVRAAELEQAFGFDIREAQALPRNVVGLPDDPQDVDDVLVMMRARKARREEQARAGVQVDEPDEGMDERASDLQGEPAIGFDTAAWGEMYRTALMYGLEPIGEEDQFRKEEDGPKLRGEYLRTLIREGRKVAIVDPLDGSNQAAGMGQRSGWACCALVCDPDQSLPAAAVLLGDGRGLVTAGNNGVWLSESHHPDKPAISYRLTPFDRARPVFKRRHWVVPAAKEKTIEHALAMIDASRDPDHKPAVAWVSPLGGNPGFAAGLLCAGAVAAVQPESYAWDQMGPYICAVAGLPTISASSPDPLQAEEIADMLVNDLMNGRKTQALYTGRTLQDARFLRAVDLAANEMQKRGRVGWGMISP